MPLLEVIPYKYPDKLLPLQKLEGLSYLMLKTVSSFVWTKHQNVMEKRTNRQTVRQTDKYPLASTAVCIASNEDAL